MASRRQFISQVASGLAGTLAAPSSVLGANERLRLGLIGAGERGIQLLREALACGGVEPAAVADIYTRRLETARAAAPGARLFRDPQALLEDPSIDAVLIATPQHLHGAQCAAALEAAKHVYVEKVMAFTLEEARLIRSTLSRNRRCVLQVGHQVCSSGLMTDALSFLSSGKVGKITAIHAHMFRNTPHGKPPWARPVYSDMTPESLDWAQFLGNAPQRDFDPHRYANWRLYWDYSGGNVFEGLSQQLAFWYKALDLEVPTAATMTGGVFLWKDGREVPDTMSVSFRHAEQLLFNWDSGFGNSQPGSSEEVLGTDGAILRSQQIRYLPQKVNQPNGVEILGRARTEPNAHMRNFLESIRTGCAPACPFELGFRVSVACRMAVESYFRQRTVRWDPAQEQIL
ncbi:MAG: Gfo/Idh/MocA family oxidoreductase [Bryobacteraceae bacterium]